MADTRLFNFELPIADVSRVSARGRSIEPPVQTKATGAALHCSVMGALHGFDVRGEQQAWLLNAYRRCGPLTDAEMESETQILRSVICARRNELIKAGVVEKDDGRTRKNPATGISNTLWRMVSPR